MENKRIVSSAPRRGRRPAFGINQPVDVTLTRGRRERVVGSGGDRLARRTRARSRLLCALVRNTDEEKRRKKEIHIKAGRYGPFEPEAETAQMSSPVSFARYFIRSPGPAAIIIIILSTRTSSGKNGRSKPRAYNILRRVRATSVNYLCSLCTIAGRSLYGARGSADASKKMPDICWRKKLFTNLSAYGRARLGIVRRPGRTPKEKGKKKNGFTSYRRWVGSRKGTS